MKITIDADLISYQDRKKLWKICTDSGGYDSIVPTKRKLKEFLTNLAAKQAKKEATDGKCHCVGLVHCEECPEWVMPL